LFSCDVTVNSVETGTEAEQIVVEPCTVAARGLVGSLLVLDTEGGIVDWVLDTVRVEATEEVVVVVVSDISLWVVLLWVVVGAGWSRTALAEDTTDTPGLVGGLLGRPVLVLATAVVGVAGWVLPGAALVRGAASDTSPAMGEHSDFPWLVLCEEPSEP